MVLEGLEIKHKAFGVGLVVDHVGAYITVRFGEVEKKFVYPDAFERFITLADGTVPEEILVDLDAAKRAKQLIIDRRNAENAHAMNRGIVIPGKEPIREGDNEDNRYKEDEN